MSASRPRLRLLHVYVRFAGGPLARCRPVRLHLLHNTYRWDFPIVGALIAPRPLLILSGQKDTIFPPDGYHEVFQRAKKVYDLYAGGGSDRIREVDDDVAHSDPPLFLREARQWMQRWLKDDTTPVPVEEKCIPEGNARRARVSGQCANDAINYNIHDQFVASTPGHSRRGMGTAPGRIDGGIEGEGVRLVSRGAGSVRGARSRGIPAVGVRATLITRSVLPKETGVRIRAQRFTAEEPRRPGPLLIYLKRPVDSFHCFGRRRAAPLLAASVLVVNPRLTEPRGPSRLHRYRTHRCLGRSHDRGDASLGYAARDRLGRR